MKTKQQLRFLATILLTTILFVLAKTDTDPLEGKFPDSRFIFLSLGVNPS